MTAGSEHEPTPDPSEVATQMRDATNRLRESGWMVAPMTQPAVAPDANSIDAPLA